MSAKNIVNDATAKSKWCPFGRVPYITPVAINRTETDLPFTRCLGSGCMAWRIVGDDDHGYCGIAGEP